MKRAPSKRSPIKTDDITAIRTAIQSNTNAFHNGDSSGINLVVTLRQTHSVVQELIDAYSRPFGLTAARSSLLLALYAAPEHTMPAYQLAATLYTTRGNITWLVGTLIDAGLVTTRPSESDRRSVLVTLSPSGLALLHDYAPRHYAALDAATKALTREERTALLALLDKLRSNAGQGVER
jgi:MarR family transcriptional repressor of emrRAB